MSFVYLQVKDSFLTAAGYARDGPDQDDVNGAGFRKRKSRFELSRTVELMTRLDADLFNQDLFMLNNIEIDVEIWPHSSEFLLISAPPAPPAAQQRYVLEIMACKLYVKTVDLMDGLSLDIARRLDTNVARYGIRKTMLKSISLTEGRTEFSYALFTEELPRRVLIGMVANSAYNGNAGNINSSPFKFQPFSVREITLNAGGRDYPQVHYELDFANSNYVRAYHDHQEFLNHAYTTESNGIDYSMFGDGWTVFAFMLTNSLEVIEGCGNYLFKYVFVVV